MLEGLHSQAMKIHQEDIPALNQKLRAANLPEIKLPQAPPSSPKH